MLTEEELKRLTAQKLPELPNVMGLEEIVKGGSDRRFYRISFAGDVKPLILMTYTAARSDNLRFVTATQRLAQLDVKVPRVLVHDDERMCMWLEDLGSIDLHAYRNEPWEVREPLYQAALGEVAKLHRVDADQLDEAELATMELRFDEALYRWEQEYFLTHFVKGLRGIEQEEVPAEVKAELEGLRVGLAELPRGLVHRDFQSQNIMIREGAAWLIDYQGVRPGLAEYDLASLLLDPYVELADTEREALLCWYAQHVGRDPNEVKERYWRCAAQRLMQALGAYGNLSRNLGKPHFEAHVPTAVGRLKAVCAQHPELRALAEWVA